MLTPQSLATFKALYKKHYGEALSDTRAREEATTLIRLVKLLLENRARRREHNS